jgi:thiamine kinase-like enzyme
MTNHDRIPPIEEIISVYHACYGASRRVLQAKLISTTTKIRKMILEYQIIYCNQAGERVEDKLIGKVYSDQKKGIESFQFLQYLWNNGFGADPQYTVVRPIAYLEQWRLMLMSKAPGRTLDDWIHDFDMDSRQLASLLADWLTRMHRIPLTVVREATRTRANADVNRFNKELSALLPQEHHSRLKSIHDEFILNSEELLTNQFVLLHGDFHTKNVFLHENQVIAIDFDHHFAGDAAWDVAYLACQIKVSGFFKKGDFNYFRGLITEFFERYLDNNPSRKQRDFLKRISLYSAQSLFESLHYEMCVLKTGNFAIVDPILSMCEHYLKGKGPE